MVPCGGWFCSSPSIGGGGLSSSSSAVISSMRCSSSRCCGVGSVLADLFEVLGSVPCWWARVLGSVPCWWARARDRARVRGGLALVAPSSCDLTLLSLDFDITIFLLF